MKIEKVLVVDDSMFMRNFLGSNIKDICKAEISYAEDGEQAVKKAEEFLPDLITLDISMPGLDGIEAIEKILEVSPKSKIVMITAVTGQSTIKEAIIKGAIDFFKKPVGREELEEMIRRHSED